MIPPSDRRLRSQPAQTCGDLQSAPLARRLVLVRHGETVGQSSIRYYGATDVALSDSGRRQMERVRAALAGEAFDAVYTSGLQRTIAAAHIVAPHISAQPVPGFNEVNFGRWEGLTREEIAARDPQLFERWRTALHEFTYPGGDAVPAFRARVATTLHAWLLATPERTLLIVHKGIIATIIAELLGLAPDERTRWPIDLASIHTLARQGLEPSVQRDRSPLGRYAVPSQDLTREQHVRHRKSLEATAGAWHAERVNQTDHLDGLE